MPVITDTAYPRLPADPGAAELDAFTPDAAEFAFVRQRTRHPGPRLALLVLLKTFQRLGYFVRLADVPAAIIGHIAAFASLDVRRTSWFDAAVHKCRAALNYETQLRA